MLFSFGKEIFHAAFPATWKIEDGQTDIFRL